MKDGKRINEAGAAQVIILDLNHLYSDPEFIMVELEDGRGYFGFDSFLNNSNGTNGTSNGTMNNSTEKISYIIAVMS